jgi:hypothetical protein
VQRRRAKLRVRGLHALQRLSLVVPLTASFRWRACGYRRRAPQVTGARPYSRLYRLNSTQDGVSSVNAGGS